MRGNKWVEKIEEKNFINLCSLFLLQACAPRYVYYIFMDRMDPVGMCFTARNNFRQIRAHRPCVESGRTVVSNLHYINFLFLFPSTPVCSCPFLSVINKKKSIGQIRLAHQDMCGTREILKDGNPLERVTRLGTISNNFSNTRRVEQVRSCAHMTHFLKKSTATIMITKYSPYNGNYFSYFFNSFFFLCFQ